MIATRKLLIMLLIFSTFATTVNGEPSGYSYTNSDGYLDGSYQLRYGTMNWSWLYNHTYLESTSDWQLDTKHTVLQKNSANNYTINNKSTVKKNYGGQIDIENMTLIFNITRRDATGLSSSNWTIYNSTISFDRNHNPKGYYGITIDTYEGALHNDFTKNNFYYTSGV